jgi:hypothetical protein
MWAREQNQAAIARPPYQAPWLCPVVVYRQSPDKKRKEKIASALRVDVLSRRELFALALGQPVFRLRLVVIAMIHCHQQDSL